MRTREHGPSQGALPKPAHAAKQLIALLGMANESATTIRCLINMTRAQYQVLREKVGPHLARDYFDYRRQIAAAFDKLLTQRNELPRLEKSIERQRARLRRRYRLALNPEVSPMEEKFRRIVEAAGGIFVEVRDGTVLFRSEPQGRTLSVYRFACNVENVRLGLKRAAEEVRELSVWEKAH